MRRYLTIILALAIRAVGQEPATEPSPAERPAPIPIQPSGTPGSKPAESSIPGLEDADFKVHPASLRREGTFFSGKRGSLVRLTGPGLSGERVFVFHADEKGKSERPMVLLPCTELQRMEQILADRTEPVAFLLFGQVFAYRGVNYLLPTAARMQQARLADTPAPDTPPVAPTPDAADPSVQSLIKQLESQRDRPHTIEPGVPLAPASDPTPAPTGATGSPKPPGETSSHVMPEGKTVLRRRARMVHAAGAAGGVGSQWDVVFDSGPQGDPDFDRPMNLVPCLTLQRMEAWAASRGDGVSLEISGQVLSYQGRNYLIPTMFRVYPTGELEPRQ